MAMLDRMDESACWLQGQTQTEVEIGVLIAAASAWTEDEMELDDLVADLVDTGRVRLQLG
jgi:hypothetical protein